MPSMGLIGVWIFTLEENHFFDHGIPEGEEKIGDAPEKDKRLVTIPVVVMIAGDREQETLQNRIFMLENVPQGAGKTGLSRISEPRLLREGYTVLNVDCIGGTQIRQFIKDDQVHVQAKWVPAGGQEPTIGHWVVMTQQTPPPQIITL